MEWGCDAVVHSAVATNYFSETVLYVCMNFTNRSTKYLKPIVISRQIRTKLFSATEMWKDTAKIFNKKSRSTVDMSWLCLRGWQLTCHCRCRSGTCSQGWCVSLRDRDFLPEGGHAWFEKYACPGCVEKGERSTRSSGSKRLSSSDTGEYSDLHASAKALWDLVLTTSISSTETAEWTCRMVINTVENQDEGRLESERRLLEVCMPMSRRGPFAITFTLKSFYLDANQRHFFQDQPLRVTLC